MGFIHDTDADPGESRAATISPGVRKYILTRANSEFDRVMRSIRADQKRSPTKSAPSKNTCCNPNYYDCHCPFPNDGLALLASSPPVRVTPKTPPPLAADRRCPQPPRPDPPLAPAAATAARLAASSRGKGPGARAPMGGNPPEYMCTTLPPLYPDDRGAPLR